MLKPAWIRCTHAESFYSNDPMDQVVHVLVLAALLPQAFVPVNPALIPTLQGDSTVVGTSKLRDLYERFEEELGRRQERAKAARPKWEPPKTKLDEDPGEGSWQLWENW